MEDLRQLLSKCPPEAWRTSPASEGVEEGIRWIPILSLTSGVTFGIADQGYWVAVKDQGELVALVGGQVHPFFPCLEESKSALKERLSEEILSRHLPLQLEDHFPFKAIMIGGLRSRSKHWPELALRWLNNDEPDSEIKTALVTVSAAPWVTQTVRQTAKRIVRKWTTEGGARKVNGRR